MHRAMALSEKFDSGDFTAEGAVLFPAKYEEN